VEDAKCNLITCKLPKKILPMQAQNAHKFLLNKLFNAHKKKTSAITGTGNPNQCRSDHIWFFPPRWRHQFPPDQLAVDSVQVTPAVSVRDHGIYPDSNMSLRSHVTQARAHVLWHPSTDSQYQTIGSNFHGQHCRRSSPASSCQNWTTATSLSPACQAAT